MTYHFSSSCIRKRKKSHFERCALNLSGMRVILKRISRVTAKSDFAICFTLLNAFLATGKESLASVVVPLHSKSHSRSLHEFIPTADKPRNPRMHLLANAKDDPDLFTDPVKRRLVPFLSYYIRHEVPPTLVQEVLDFSLCKFMVSIKIMKSSSVPMVILPRNPAWMERMLLNGCRVQSWNGDFPRLQVLELPCGKEDVGHLVLHRSRHPRLRKLVQNSEAVEYTVDRKHHKSIALQEKWIHPGQDVRSDTLPLNWLAFNDDTIATVVDPTPLRNIANLRATFDTLAGLESFFGKLLGRMPTEGEPFKSDVLERFSMYYDQSPFSGIHFGYFSLMHRLFLNGLELTLDGKNLPQLKTLICNSVTLNITQEFPSLVSLQLRRCKIQDWKEFKAPCLRSISLKAMSIPADFTIVLSNFPALRHISLSWLDNTHRQLTDDVLRSYLPRFIDSDSTCPWSQMTLEVSRLIPKDTMAIWKRTFPRWTFRNLQLDDIYTADHYWHGTQNDDENR